MLLTISLKTCSRQHLNYFKTLPSFFNTHQLSCFKSLTRMWKPQCQNNCCSLLGFWQATFNLKPSKNGYFYLFFFFKFRSDYIDCIPFPCSDRLEMGARNAWGRIWQYCLVFTQPVHLPKGLPQGGCEWLWFPKFWAREEAKCSLEEFWQCGWGCCDVLGSQKSRTATPSAYRLPCHNSTEPCPHK